jgi:hypothetical protein
MTQLLPTSVFEIDAERQEPYLRLPAPHENIIITPPHLSDSDRLVEILNDPRVYVWLSGPPHPYLQEHAAWWLTRVTKRAAESWAEIREVSDRIASATEIALGPEADEASKHTSMGQEETKPMFGDCPVRSIRQVNPDGSWTYLGDVELSRWGFLEVADEEERKRLNEENEKKKIGDPDIIWTFGGLQLLLYVPTVC